MTNFNDFLHARAGAPHFFRKLRLGQPVKVVAFGTSMSHDGYYLSRLVSSLSAAFDRTPISLEVIGLRASSVVWAPFHIDRVIAEAPDFVLLEFSINDNFMADEMTQHIQWAMRSMIDRINAAYPDCDFLHVYFAVPGEAASGPTTAINAHEVIARLYDNPSIDLAQYSESLLKDGLATWHGPRALTHDGIHHTLLAAEMIAQPFAGACVSLVAQSGTVKALPPGTETAYHRAGRTSIRALPHTGDAWEFGPPRDTMNGAWSIAAFVDEIAIAVKPGAAFHLVYTGTELFLWIYTDGGRLKLTLDGREQFIDIPVEANPQFRTFSFAFPDGNNDLRCRL